MDSNSDCIETIKKCALRGIAASDAFREMLVLKGGNAIDLAHGLGSRASIDLDFSMSEDFADVASAGETLESNLSVVFLELGLRVFDFKMEPKPNMLSKEIADFWGGYKVSFKVIESVTADRVGPDINQLRNYAVSVTPMGAKTFTVDISKYEYCQDKESCDFEGVTFYVYSLPMIAAEKFRAICQQMPEYGPIVRRTRAGAPRARDFLDLHDLISAGYANPDSTDFQDLIRKIFAVKRVPLALIGKIYDFREFHSGDFPSVVDTVKPGKELEAFDFYFDFVCGVCRRLEPLWNV